MAENGKSIGIGIAILLKSIVNTPVAQQQQQQPEPLVIRTVILILGPALTISLH